MLTRLLVTGFGPFHAVETNSSELVVRELPNILGEKQGFCLRTRIFPVIYETASEEILQTIRTTNPDVLIMIGVSESANKLQLERVARNLDCSETFDNQSVLRKNQRILNDGPDQYLTALPLNEYADALTEAGIPTQVSEDAGGFLCNHYYYRACHHLAVVQVDCNCLFVHVPSLLNCERKHSQDPKLSVSSAAKGIVLLVQKIKENMKSLEPTRWLSAHR